MDTAFAEGKADATAAGSFAHAVGVVVEGGRGGVATPGVRRRADTPGMC